MCCKRLAGNAGPKKSPKIHHLGTIAQLCRGISSQIRRVSTIGKNSLNSSTFSTHGVPAQETVKDRAKFGWPPVSDVVEEAKTRNPLKFARVSQTNETISAASSPYCENVWRAHDV